MDKATAEECAAQLIANGFDDAEAKPVAGKPDTYEVFAYLDSDPDRGRVTLFSIQAQTPIYKGERD